MIVLQLLQKFRIIIANGKRRQICRKHSIIKKFLITGAIIVDHVQTNDNLTDPSMIGVVREKVFKTQRMRLKPIKKIESPVR